MRKNAIHVNADKVISKVKALPPIDHNAAGELEVGAKNVKLNEIAKSIGVDIERLRFMIKSGELPIASYHMFNEKTVFYCPAYLVYRYLNLKF